MIVRHRCNSKKQKIPDGKISALNIGISIVVLVTVTTLSRINRIAGPKKKYWKYGSCRGSRSYELRNINVTIRIYILYEEDELLALVCHCRVKP